MMKCIRDALVVSAHSKKSSCLKQKKKEWENKLFSVVLATTLVVSMTPSYVAFAEEDMGSSPVTSGGYDTAAKPDEGTASESDIASAVADESSDGDDYNYGALLSVDSANGDSSNSAAGEDSESFKNDASESDDADKDNEDDEEKLPAVELYAAANGTTVKVTAPEGALPKGASITAVDVTNASIRSAVEGVSNSTVKSIQAIDVTIHDKDGKEVQPKKSVNVTFFGAGMTGGDDVNVYHYANGSIESINALQADANVQSFSAEHFSVYVVTDETWIATYNFHDADGVIVSSQAVKSGEELYAPDTPEKDGFVFKGWTADPDSSTIAQEAFDDPIIPEVAGTETIDWYPAYAEVHYVFFMDNQGRISTTRQGEEGEEIPVSDVRFPLDSTHNVTGWYDNPELSGDAVDSVILGTDNVTLYPRVEEGNYLIFVTGEGASYIQPMFYFINQATEGPADPIRPGYEFVGWSQDESATAVDFDFGENIDKKTTAYAVWKPDASTKYTVVYWKQSVSNNKNITDNSQKTYDFAESATRTGTTGTTVTPHNDKSYAGFHYSWNSGSAKIAGNGTTILNVYYDRDFLTIHFKEQWLGQWVEYMTFTGLYGQTLTQNSYIWPTSYRWVDRGDIDMSFLDAFLFDDLDDVTEDGGKTLTLFGHAVTSGRTVNFYKQNLDGSYSYGSPTNSVQISDRSRFTITEKYNGFTASGYYVGNNPWGGNWTSARTGDTIPGGKSTLNIRFSRNSYALSYYNMNHVEKSVGGIFHEASLVDYEDYTPSRPSELSEDYEFKGWYKDEDCTVKFDFDTTMPADNLIVYAKWEVPTEKCIAHTTINGGDGDAPVTLAISYGEKINPNDLPTVKDSNGDIIQAGSSVIVTIPPNNQWAGWATKDSGGYTLFNYEDTHLYRDIELYPYYMNSEKFTVSYDIGSGAGSVIDSKKYAQDSYADVQPATNIVAPRDKVFLHWKGLDGKAYYPGDKIKIDGNVELTAVYGDKSALTSLTIDPNYPDGTSSTPVVISYANNETLNLPSAPVCEGYDFVEWNTKPDGSGDGYMPEELVGLDVKPGSPIAPTVVEHALYGKWKTNIVVAISGKTDVVTYDGKEHSVSGYNASYTVAGKKVQKLPEGVSVSFKGGTPAVSGTDAKDSYTLSLSSRDFTAEYDDSKYNVTIVVNQDKDQLKLTINKRDVEITSESATKQYDGIALIKEKSSVTSGSFVGDEGYDATYTGSQTLVGSSANTFSYTLNGGAKAGNYNIATKNGTLEVIDRAIPYEITIEASSGEFGYDGTEKSISGLKTTEFIIGDDAKYSASSASKVKSAISGLIAGTRTARAATHGIKFTVSGLEAGAKGIDAGTYDAKVTGTAVVRDSYGNDVTSQFKINPRDGKLIIEKRAVTFTGDSVTKIYNGQEQEITTYTNDNLVTGHVAAVDYRAAGTKPGIYKGIISEPSKVIIMDASRDVTNNYTVKTIAGKLTIASSEIDGKVVLNGSNVSRTYNGTAWAAGDATAVDTLGANDVKVEYSVDDSTWTEDPTTITRTYAGVTNIRIRASVPGVYDGYVYGEETLEVSKARLVVTTGSSSKVYDGNELTNGEIIVEGLIEGDATFKTTGTQTEVGSSDNTYEIVWNGDMGSNYRNPEDHLGTLTVTEKSVDLGDDAKKTDPDKRKPDNPGENVRTGDSIGITLTVAVVMLISVFLSATALLKRRGRK